MMELEAINEMLEAIGRPSVPDLSGDLAGEAQTILDRERRRILAQGWHANTDRERTFTPNGQDEVTLDDILSIRPVWKGADLDPRTPRPTDNTVSVGIRDGKLYDHHEQTFEFDDDQTLEVVELIDFDKLPDPLADYIARSACLRFERFQKRGQFDDQIQQQELLQARARAEQHDIEMAGINVLDTREARRVRGRRRFTWRDMR